MNDSLFPWPFAGRTEDAIRLEAFETPEWCAAAILRRELLTPRVVDPCCGHGTLSKAAIKVGYSGTPTAHAWFVWERGHPPGTTLGHLDRSAP
jgi:hypothetical protein